MTPAALTEEKPLRLGQEVRSSWVRDLDTLLGDVGTILVARIDRVPTRDLNQLRNALETMSGSFHVVKNSLCRKVFKKQGWEGIGAFLQGTCGISPIQGDVAAVCKLLVQFSKDHEGFVLQGGRVGKDLLQAKDLVVLAKLPSRQVLLGQLAAVAISPVRSLAVVLQAPLRNLALLLKAVGEKKPES